MVKYLAVAIFNLHNDVNVGTIIRSANAFGAQEIAIIGRKQYNTSAATGGQSSMKVQKFKITDEFLEYCTKEGFSLVSIEITSSAKSLYEYQFPEKTMLIVGNEGSGVPEKILSLSSAVVRIPQFGSVECLNVAVSASIACYEWSKQQELKERNIDGFKFLQ
jgi:tRNA G18 (ribose-2'-O)-methylase SpoU